MDLELSLSGQSQIQNQLTLVPQERNRLIGEVEGLRRQLTELRANSGRLEQLNTQINGLLSENERLNNSLGERAGEIDRLKRKVVELETNTAVIPHLQDKLVLVSGENERLNMLVIERLREVEALRK